jgi:hypothetical protein
LRDLAQAFRHVPSLRNSLTISFRDPPAGTSSYLSKSGLFNPPPDRLRPLGYPAARLQAAHNRFAVRLVTGVLPRLALRDGIFFFQKEKKFFFVFFS